MTVSFWTPIKYEHPTYGQHCFERIEQCFAFDPTQYALVTEQTANIDWVRLTPEACYQTYTPYARTCHTLTRIALAIFACLTIIPLFIKCYFRISHTFVNRQAVTHLQYSSEQQSSRNDLRITLENIHALQQTWINRTNTLSEKEKQVEQKEKQANPLQHKITLPTQLTYPSTRIENSELSLIQKFRKNPSLASLITVKTKSETTTLLYQEVMQFQFLKTCLDFNKNEKLCHTIDLTDAPFEEETIHQLLDYIKCGHISGSMTLMQLFNFEQLMLFFGGDLIQLSPANDLLRLPDAQVLTFRTEEILECLSALSTTSYAGPLLDFCLAFLAKTHTWLYQLDAESAENLVAQLTHLDHQGHAWAQVALGRCHIEGIHLPFDLHKAEELFAKADASNNARGTAYLGFLNASMPTAAMPLFKRASEQYDLFGIACLNAQRGWVTDVLRAMKEGANHCFCLHLLRQHGHNIKKDIRCQAILDKGIELNDPWAYVVKGVSYEMGLFGVNKNAQLAFQCYQDAAACNLSLGLLYLGECYHYGSFNTPIDLDLARKYYRLAAERGSPTAEQRLTQLAT